MSILVSRKINELSHKKGFHVETLCGFQEEYHTYGGERRVCLALALSITHCFFFTKLNGVCLETDDQVSDDFTPDCDPCNSTPRVISV